MSLVFDPNVNVRENEPLSRYSSFKIGGCAKYVILPQSIKEFLNVIDILKNNKIKHIVVGNGSNLLFDDEGYDGAVIVTKYMNSTEYIHKNKCTYIKCECGKSLTELSSEVGKKHSLSGLEFAYGIPGTVGGAVFMNAGAYGGQMSDIIEETEFFDLSDGEIKKLSNEGQKFDYRHSIFAEHPEYIILSTTLKLHDGDPEEIFAHMTKNMSARKEKQPLEYPNAGSTFKRPGNGLFAGKLIEDSNLKGYTVGGAQISQKHAGFTINTGNATCADVLAVIKHTKETVFEKFGVMLECEIICVPK